MVKCRKSKFFGFKEFFSRNFHSKNLRIIIKKYADDPDRGSQKIDFNAVWTPESNPTAWELTSLYQFLSYVGVAQHFSAKKTGEPSTASPMKI